MSLIPRQLGTVASRWPTDVAVVRRLREPRLFIARMQIHRAKKRIIDPLTYEETHSLRHTPLF